jgi:hypothetical protein
MDYGKLMVSDDLGRTPVSRPSGIASDVAVGAAIGAALSPLLATTSLTPRAVEGLLWARWLGRS